MRVFEKFKASVPADSGIFMAVLVHAAVKENGADKSSHDVDAGMEHSPVLIMGIFVKPDSHQHAGSCHDNSQAQADQFAQGNLLLCRTVS